MIYSNRAVKNSNRQPLLYSHTEISWYYFHSILIIKTAQPYTIHTIIIYYHHHHSYRMGGKRDLLLTSPVIILSLVDIVISLHIHDLLYEHISEQPLPLCVVYDICWHNIMSKLNCVLYATIVPQRFCILLIMKLKWLISIML